MAVSTDDLAAFAALRSLVDEFSAASDAPEASNEPFVALQGSLQAEKAQRKPRRRRAKAEVASSPPSSSSEKQQARQSYNPNRARDDERRELGELRDEVSELTQQLEALREVKRSCSSCKRRAGDASHESVELPRDIEKAALVWKEIANDQFQQHMRAVRENRRLKRVVEGHREITTGLKRLLEQRTASETCKLFEGEPRAWPMMALAPDLNDPAIYQELLSGLDKSYQEAASIFFDSGLSETDIKGDSRTLMHEDASGNLYAQIFAHKIFPFDVPTTGLVSWKHFSFCVRPNCTSFFSQLGAENVEESDDTVAESFGIEFRYKTKTALFRGKQIKRRYIEADREVIVWQAYVNPIEFDGRPISGAAFRERGYFIVRRPTTIAPTDTFSLLQTCYVLTPNVPVRTLPQDSIAGALVNFVLNCMAASIPVNHHIIENLLFDVKLEQQAMRQCGIK